MKQSRECIIYIPGDSTCNKKTSLTLRYKLIESVKYITIVPVAPSQKSILGAKRNKIIKTLKHAKLRISTCTILQNAIFIGDRRGGQKIALKKINKKKKLWWTLLSYLWKRSDVVRVVVRKHCTNLVQVDQANGDVYNCIKNLFIAGVIYRWRNSISRRCKIYIYWLTYLKSDIKRIIKLEAGRPR